MAGWFGGGKSVWAEGVRSVFIVPLIPDTSGSIPDTSGIRGLAQAIPKCVFSLPIPFSIISQSKKDIKEAKPNIQFKYWIESKGSRGAALLGHTGHIR